MLTGLTVVLNLWLIPLFGLNGAALATALAVFTLNLVQLLFVWWKFRMQPFSGRTVVGLLVMGGVMAGGSLIPRMGFLVLDAAVRSLICSAVYWVLVLRLHISEDVREYLERNLDRLGLGGVVRRLS